VLDILVAVGVVQVRDELTQPILPGDTAVHHWQ
jgi:hypothetical protein